MQADLICVLGGTGFLGRRIVRHLRDHGLPVRVVSRHPGRSRFFFPGDDPHLVPVKADIEDERSLAAAIDGANGLVNAVSLYVERAGHTFRSVHVDAAARVAAHARQAGLRHLVHVSGIGADLASDSPYVRSRAEGELAVRAEFPAAIVVRPSVMFGPDDAFLNTTLALLERLPAFPLFGRGKTRLQPVFVDDVAEAIARSLEHDVAAYDLGGPKIYDYEELIRTIATHAGLSPILFPVPFPAWQMLARTAELLPNPPLARAQVELMEIDNIASASLPGFAALGISPQPLEPILEAILSRRSGRA